jgi:hypothetical protein
MLGDIQQERTMSDASAFGFGKFIPGFDFLQNIAQSAGKSQPGAAPSWVAPTLSVEELDKRITDLKAVQFWLEQNVTTLKATIQAMEVQKMTLATLQGMNVNMADLAKAFSVKPESAAEAPKAEAAQAPEPEPEPAAAQQTEPEVEAKPTRKTKAKAADKPMVDPMAWWGSLSQQFQNIAATAMKDVAAEAMKAKSASAAEGKPSEAAQPAAKKAVRKPAAKKTTAKKPATKAAARTASRKTAAK